MEWYHLTEKQDLFLQRDVQKLVLEIPWFPVHLLRSFSILVLLNSLCKLFPLLIFLNSCGSRFNETLRAAFLTHRVTVSAFGMNIFHTPGNLLSLLIVVSMTLSASLRLKGFTQDNCTKKFPKISCSWIKDRFVGRLRSSPSIGVKYFA